MISPGQPAALPGSTRLSAARLAELVRGITLHEGAHEDLAVRAPFTGAVLGSIPLGRDADVEAAVARARAAQAPWSARPIAERSAVLLRFHDLLLERQDEALDLIQLETGKARRHAFEEVLDLAVVSRYYARAAERLLRPRRRRGALPLLTKTWELRSPVGVVGFLSPWNYPLSLAISDALPALMAGNAAVLRPDPQTSFTALWAVSLLREAGLPPDVLTVVTGEGPVIGPALTGRVDFLMFTGSTRTGRVVAKQAAERLIGCSLELGGKNPMIVLGDAHIDAAVDGAVRGCFVAAGQLCVSIERIFVQQSVYPRFLDRFVDRVRKLKIGPAMDFSVEMGSLASERQLATVEDHVADAVAKGATLLAGGRRLPELGPYFYEPAILIGVTREMKLYAEETFGPVVAVYPFATVEEAVARANETRYGLSASVYTRDAKKAARLARAIRAGSVNVNEPYAATWGSVDSAIGGMKESGVGRRHGAEGILKFTETQTVAVQRWLPIAPPRGMSPATYARIMTALMKLFRRARFLG